MSHRTAGRIFAVINPVAGSCQAALVQTTLEEACMGAGLHCDCYFTQPGADIIGRVRQALRQGYERVVAAGGDGTVAAVATALANQSIPLAVLPVGTANLLARELDIPLDLAAACELATRGQTLRAIDAMQINGQLFLSHISLGVYSKIAENTSTTAKRYFRQIAYVWNAIPELLGRRTWRFALQVDGQVSRPRASFIMIANVGGIGAGDLRWGPDIRPDDGEVNICIVHARKLWDYVVLGWHVLTHRHDEAPKLAYQKAKHNVAIRAHKRVPVRGDGEIIGQTAVDIAILPHALNIVISHQ